MIWIDKLARRYWIWRTGADPVVILNQNLDLEALNSLHVRFIEHLRDEYPELKTELDVHEFDRFNTLHPTVPRRSSAG